MIEMLARSSRSNTWFSAERSPGITATATVGKGARAAAAATRCGGGATALFGLGLGLLTGEWRREVGAR
jgi:hypothetical protein